MKAKIWIFLAKANPAVYECVCVAGTIGCDVVRAWIVFALDCVPLTNVHKPLPCISALMKT